MRILDRRRGSGGQLATWRYDYTTAVADEYFDCVAVLQAVQHTDNWRETGKELLRIMKRRRNILLAEITFKNINEYAALDLHRRILAGKDVCARRYSATRHSILFPGGVASSVLWVDDRGQSIRLEGTGIVLGDESVVSAAGYFGAERQWAEKAIVIACRV